MSPAKLAQLKPKPATTPAAWLTQMAADAGHMHVKRIAELGELLRAKARLPGLAAVASRLEKLADDLPDLDFSLLEPRGLWARALGKSKGSGSEFAHRFEEVGGEAAEIAATAMSLGSEQKADAAPLERALVELEVEFRAVEKIIDQGARWLQDMRNQIKLRQAAATDPQARRAVLEDSARCDILVDRLKMLRALCNACAPVPDLVRAYLHKRDALLQALHKSLVSEVDDWHGVLAPVAAVAAEGQNPAQGIEPQLEAHKDLEKTVGKAVSACQQLLGQEQELAASLAALSATQFSG
ncbi:hypothetical protein ACFPOE_23265 [Caenimonas terrae]|uniref:Uncharacterized protein n=1 Tax=Caenimonas terrae TaxID=696074 RepID=A0ABW0NJB5_9BURK